MMSHQKKAGVPLALQIIRYGAVGLLNSALGYLIYLSATWMGLSPTIAVTLLYPIGAFIGYFGHAKYSFEYNEAWRRSAFRYVISHVLGYFSNLLLLYVFYRRLGFPHQAVQAAAIFIVAGQLFLLFKYYAFRVATHPRSR